MTDNPLLPMVRELADALVAAKSGKLYARSSVDGPQSLEELRVLLERAGMLAAAWRIETAQHDYYVDIDKLQKEAVEKYEEDDRIDEIKAVLLERIPVWQMLKRVQHVLYDGEVPTPAPPRMINDNGKRWTPDDDIPF